MIGLCNRELATVWSNVSLDMRNPHGNGCVDRAR